MHRLFLQMYQQTWSQGDENNLDQVKNWYNLGIIQIHYSEMHSKQRQRFFACPMCDHKSNDVNNMKRHINTVHNSEARRVYRLLCDNLTTTTIRKPLVTKSNEISETLPWGGFKVSMANINLIFGLWLPLLSFVSCFRFDGHHISGVTNVTFSQTKKPCCYNTDTVLMRVWQYLQG